MAVATDTRDRLNAPSRGPVDRLFKTVELVRRNVEHLDPYALQASELVETARLYAEIGKLADAAKLLLVPAIERQAAFRKGGHKNTAEMLAQQGGTSTGAAHAAVNTAKKLRARPKTAAKVRKGKLSAAEAAILSDAHPDDEDKLLDVAERGGYGRLRDAAEDAKAARTSEESAMEQYRRVHAERGFRKWTKNGAFCFAGSTTLDRGAEWMSAVEHERQRLYDEARREGRAEDPMAYLLDAIINVSMGTDGPKPQRPKASMLLRADAAAIIRGYLEQSERCEIVGFGPIPITVARWLLHDADVHGVVLEGDDVRAVTSTSRHIPDKVKKAILAQQPCCAVPGCTQTKGLEFDHIEEYAKGGPTALGNLDPLCRPHHRLKTLFGWRLQGPRGNRQWLPPPVPDT